MGLELHPAQWWHQAEDGRVSCDLCPRRCQLADGQSGACFIRQNHGGQLVLTSYGQSSGFCLDPIEKKPLNHFYPGSSVLSFGTAGCNLACKFCQNWEISKSRHTQSLSQHASPDMLAQAAQQLNAASVAFTYNDPVIFAEYAIATAQACHRHHVHSVAVTAGYIEEEPRQAFFSVMDASNVDLKAFSEEFYRKFTGSHLQPVLDTLQYLIHHTQVWVEITTLLIPGLNDSDDEIQRLSQWIKSELRPDVPLHFSGFHPDFRLRDIGPTPRETLLRARSIALSQGLHYVFTGNIHDAESQSSYCPQCRQMVIQRQGYQLSQYRLNDNGQCLQCAYPIAGRFSAFKGSFGNQRVAISFK